MAFYRVAVYRADLNSTAGMEEDNLLQVLPYDHVVERISGSDNDEWWKIKTTLRGQEITGFVVSETLERTDDIEDETPEFSSEHRIPEVHLKENYEFARRDTRARGWAYPIGEPDRPQRKSGSPPAKAQELSAIIDWLDVESSARYRPEQNTYCNIYAYDVCYLSGVYIPRVWWMHNALLSLMQGHNVTARYGRTVREMAANDLHIWMDEFSKHFGWRPSHDLNELQESVNLGMIGIISSRHRKPNKSGHICVVAPERGANTAKRRGTMVVEPLMSQAGRHNRKYFVSRWWTSASYADFGFWIHD